MLLTMSIKQKNKPLLLKALLIWWLLVTRSQSKKLLTVPLKLLKASMLTTLRLKKHSQLCLLRRPVLILRLPPFQVKHLMPPPIREKEILPTWSYGEKKLLHSTSRSKLPNKRWIKSTKQSQLLTVPSPRPMNSWRTKTKIKHKFMLKLKQRS